MKPRYEILTLFPELLEKASVGSVLGRGQAAGLFEVCLRQIRDYAEGKHRVCDDSPYGGGAGMVMKPGPLVRAIEAAKAESPCPEQAKVYLLGPGGQPFGQAMAASLMKDCPHLILVCGRYEGMDERVRAWVDGEISVGDYVLSGGEPAAWVVVDAMARLLPGVLGNESSTEAESFQDGLLEYPHYTRPALFRGHKVPEVLLSGDHAKVAAWRRKRSLERTQSVRPDLLAKAPLEPEEASEFLGKKA